MLLSLAVGVAGMTFPFLPRHLTLIGAITIGIPSFFLALAPSSRRFRPGFVHRVLRFTIPTGILAATATFLGYALATHEPGVSTLEAQTTAVMTLMWVGLLVLSIVAAPLDRGRLALVWAMGTAAVLAFVLPVTQSFFALDPPPHDRLVGVDRNRGAHLDVRTLLRSGGAPGRNAMALGGVRKPARATTSRARATPRPMLCR